MNQSNIIILGTSGSGKTTAIKHLNYENIEIQSFDYGKAIIGGETAYIFSSAQSDGFLFIDELFSLSVDGIIVFIDNQKGINDTDLEIMNFIDNEDIPYVIFANKQDLDNSILNIDLDVFVVPTIATEGTGIKEGFKMLLKLTENQIVGKNSERSMKDIVKDIKRQKEEKSSKKPDIKELAKKIKPAKIKDSSKICKIKLFMHPIELDNVKKALVNVGFSNLTIIEVGYVEDSVKSKESYRGKDYNSNIPKREEINIIIKYEDTKYVIEALKAVKNEDIYDNMYITPIDEVIRIRTEERGEEAVE